MSEPHLPRLADLPHRVREYFATWPENWQTWRRSLREDPAVLWRTPIVRIVVYVALAMAAIFAVQWTIGALTPGDVNRVGERATPWATLYVACTNPACRAAYKTQTAMDFKAWPMKCTKCGQLTVYRAQHCKVCGRSYAVAPGTTAATPGAATDCPFCAEKRAAQTPPPAPTTTRAHTDDDEDPWH